VRRAALVGVGDRGAKRPVVILELRERRKPRRSLLEELHAIAARHPHTAIIDTFLFHPRFPVDIRHNAKIGREQLAGWAAKRLQEAR
jgi:hypothetical protein